MLNFCIMRFIMRVMKQFKNILLLLCLTNVAIKCTTPFKEGLVNINDYNTEKSEYVKKAIYDISKTNIVKKVKIKNLEDICLKIKRLRREISKLYTYQCQCPHYKNSITESVFNHIITCFSKCGKNALFIEQSYKVSLKPETTELIKKSYKMKYKTRNEYSKEAMCNQSIIEHLYCMKYCEISNELCRVAPIYQHYLEAIGKYDQSVFKEAVHLIYECKIYIKKNEDVYQESKEKTAKLFTPALIKLQYKPEINHYTQYLLFFITNINRRMALQNTILKNSVNDMKHFRLITMYCVLKEISINMPEANAIKMISIMNDDTNIKSSADLCIQTQMAFLLYSCTCLPGEAMDNYYKNYCQARNLTELHDFFKTCQFENISAKNMCCHIEYDENPTHIYASQLRDRVKAVIKPISTFQCFEEISDDIVNTVLDGRETVKIFTKKATRLNKEIKCIQNAQKDKRISKQSLSSLIYLKKQLKTANKNSEVEIFCEEVKKEWEAYISGNRVGKLLKYEEKILKNTTVDPEIIAEREVYSFTQVKYLYDEVSNMREPLCNHRPRLATCICFIMIKEMSHEDNIENREKNIKHIKEIAETTGEQLSIWTNEYNTILEKLYGYGLYNYK